MDGGLREVDQARPHQTMEIRDPGEEAFSVKDRLPESTAKRDTHCPAIYDLLPSLGDGEKSSRDSFHELGANPVHLVHDASS